VLIPQNALNEIRNLTEERGVDHLFEAAGVRHTLQNAWDAVSQGGNPVVLGKMPQDAQISGRWGLCGG
jgi:threonine dehydrogenase-like Zn-dependent dehydrogenase